MREAHHFQILSRFASAIVNKNLIEYLYHKKE